MPEIPVTEKAEEGRLKSYVGPEQKCKILFEK
jgi:hypothetical protein